MYSIGTWLGKVIHVNILNTFNRILCNRTFPSINFNLLNDLLFVSHLFKFYVSWRSHIFSSLENYILMGRTQPLLVYFSFYRHKFCRKKCRLHRDSNSDCCCRGWARWPIDWPPRPLKITKSFPFWIETFLNKHWNTIVRRNGRWIDGVQTTDLQYPRRLMYQWAL